MALLMTAFVPYPYIPALAMGQLPGTSLRPDRLAQRNFNGTLPLDASIHQLLDPRFQGSQGHPDGLSSVSQSPGPGSILRLMVDSLPISRSQFHCHSKEHSQISNERSN
ncbi:hypothetical protein P3W43_02500 [Salinicola salarius]|uniref:hypothetical protein n=1 Tax=Salinicola salarius TaxID=430457 RepID=UPI0023E3B1B6|nr:hypothetical protein [Salinicola salarius]MDF3917724.1 hypothetical protein [Salinicola salarius]